MTDQKEEKEKVDSDAENERSLKMGLLLKSAEKSYRDSFVAKEMLCFEFNKWFHIFMKHYGNSYEKTKYADLLRDLADHDVSLEGKLALQPMKDFQTSFFSEYFHLI